MQNLNSGIWMSLKILEITLWTSVKAACAFIHWLSHSLEPVSCYYGDVCADLKLSDASLLIVFDSKEPEGLFCQLDYPPVSDTHLPHVCMLGRCPARSWAICQLADFWLSQTEVCEIWLCCATQLLKCITCPMRQTNQICCCCCCCCTLCCTGHCAFALFQPYSIKAFIERRCKTEGNELSALSDTLLYRSCQMESCLSPLCCQ